MKAMVLQAPGQALRWAEMPDPVPGPGQVVLRVSACAVCRTDLHVVDSELAVPKLLLIYAKATNLPAISIPSTLDGSEDQGILS